MTLKASHPGKMQPAVLTTTRPFVKELTPLVLAISLLLGPSAPVFPQEAGDPGNSELPIEATSATASSPADADEGKLSAPAVTEGSDPQDAADNAESPDFFENKSTLEERNVGSISADATTGESGTFQPTSQSAVKQIIPEPDPTTGALIFSYPLTVPPGRRGLTPDLKLTYNSQDSKKGSYLGDRWSLNIPFIERLNKTGTDRLYADNFFTSSLGGELVLVSGTIYAPKVENGDFLKYRFDGTSWTVTDKSGTAYKFGAQASTRQDDPNDATKVYRWMLEEVRDTNGNFISYAYYKDSGQIYPGTVTYTGNGTMNGIFKVTFARGAYDDMSPSLYYADFKVKTAYRVTSISITVSGEWVRKYDLGYMTGDMGYRAMLASITESGRDLDTNTVTALPAATFAYKTRGPLGWDQMTNWQMPRWFVDRHGESTMLQVADINGDSYADVAYADSTINTAREGAYISNTSNGWNGDDANWLFPIWIKNSVGFKDNGVRIFDVNGDLLADVVRSFSTKSGDPYPAASSVYLNSGDPATGWVETSSIAVPIGFVFGASLYADDAVRIVDVNGDGLADLVRAYLDDDYAGGLLNQSVHLGTGTGWTAAAPGTWQVPFPIIDENPYSGEVYTFVQFADINGDNLPDILWRYSSVSGYWWPASHSSPNRTFINNGHGWDLISTQIPVPFEAHQYIQYANSDNGARASDLNGDGIPDILWSGYATSFATGSNAYLNSGAETDYPYSLFSSINAPEQFARAGKQTNMKVQLADVNADGLDDFVYSERNGDNVFLTRTHLARPNSFTDLLTSVTAPTGGSHAITYKLSNQYRNGDNSLTNPKFPLVIPTVEQITATDPVAGVSGTSTWSYQDGSYYYSSPTDRRFAGFGVITKTDPTGSVTKTYYHQGNASNASQGEYIDDPAKIGKAYRIELYDGAGNLYAVTVNKLDKYNLGADRDFVKLVARIAFTYDGNGTHKDVAQEFVYDNIHGNLTQRVDWGEVTASADGSFTDTGSDKSTENILYVANTSNYVVGLPYQDTVLDQSSNKVRETRTYYDALALGAVGAGNPTKTEQWVTGTTYIDSQRAYNTTYATVTTTDPRGKVTTADTFWQLPPSRRVKKCP